MVKLTGHILILFRPVTALIYIRETSIQTRKLNTQIRTMRVMRIPTNRLTNIHLLTLRLLLAGGPRKILPLWALIA
jgi:hypothetical protein